LYFFTGMLSFFSIHHRKIKNTSKKSKKSN
jgi:hypothetical protein